jgi:hypothetical protein
MRRNARHLRRALSSFEKFEKQSDRNRDPPDINYHHYLHGFCPG